MTTKIMFRLKGGPGSGHKGHRGIPGIQGGSLPDDEPSSNPHGGPTVADMAEIQGGGKTLYHTDFVKLPGSNEGIAYVVDGALRGTRNGGDAAQAFIDSVEDQNFYGNKPEIVKQRNKALDIFKDQLKRLGVKFDDAKYQKYVNSQSDEEENVPTSVTKPVGDMPPKKVIANVKASLSNLAASVNTWAARDTIMTLANNYLGTDYVSLGGEQGMKTAAKLARQLRTLPDQFLLEIEDSGHLSGFYMDVSANKQPKNKPNADYDAMVDSRRRGRE